MEPVGETPASVLAKAAAAAAAVFIAWFLFTRDTRAAVLYAGFIAVVEVVLGFAFRAWRRGRDRSIDVG